jgi:predicted component of viral defense system (DUF524 family)
MDPVKLSYFLKSNDGNEVKLDIYSESDDPDCLKIISEEEASEFGEAEVQLKEEFCYEYRLPDGYQLSGDRRVIKTSKTNPSSGRLTPGVFVGTLKLDIIDTETNAVKTGVSFEIRSVKTDYRSDYRNMLEYITNKCTDLLMQYSSPSAQAFTINYNKNSSTLYQQFAFIKSIIDTDEFNDALMRIVYAPVTDWIRFNDETDIRGIKRVTRKIIKQLSGGSKRINLPDNHSLYNKLKSVPYSLSVDKKVDTPDTPENRFVKHALNEFSHFCLNLKNRFEKRSRAYKEAENIAEKLESILGHDIFKKISHPATLPLNSPVLQRREGYREVLRVWLMFDLASRLIWKGGDDIYDAGKRDVAVLYEYWLFFKLLELFEELFKLDKVSVKELIGPTDDGLSLKLKAGKHIALKGEYSNKGRKLSVEFSYNRTFNETTNNYPSSGSWTRSMRPDYTLSLWPCTITKEKAEEQELIIHIHFDAKYRVDAINAFIETGDPDIEKSEELEGTYKRADLLKMHAYKDAVRRTSGAYVIYPGDITKRWYGYHEIIPGLGAFAVKPDKYNTGINEIKKFVKDVLDNFSNRISQREQLSYHLYEIHKKTPDSHLHENFPEIYKGERTSPLSETYVLVGYSSGGAKYDWVTKKKLYNARMESDRGSIRLGPKNAGASYLLIHQKGQLQTGDLWHISEKGPRVFSKDKLLEMGYPDPSQDNYIVYEIEKAADKEFAGVTWDVTKLAEYKSGHASALPFAVTLAELMKVKI